MISHRAKAIVCYGLLILFGILAIVSFSIPFVSIKVEGQVLKISGFDYLSASTAQGEMPDELYSIGITGLNMAKAFVISALVFGSAMILDGIIGLCFYFVVPARTAGVMTRFAEISCAVALALTAIFATFYYVMSFSLFTTLKAGLNAADVTFKIYMIGVIPIVLWSVMGVVYVVLSALMRGSNGNEVMGTRDVGAVAYGMPAQNRIAVAESPDTERMRIETLRSYRRLLDDGIITQEEFDTRKKLILG